MLERKQAQIDSIWDKPIDTLIGKVTASSKHFPYVETHPSVYIDDPIECDRREKRRKEIQKEIDSLKLRITEIEKFIDNIADPELKDIFEMRVYEGMKWTDIATEIDDNKDRTTYSKKFKKYLENSHNSPISQKQIV